MTSAVLMTIEAQRVDGGVRKLRPDPDRRISRTEAGERCNPPVKRGTVMGYNQLAINHLKKYREAFYVWQEGKRVINLELPIPETHLPVIQAIREEFHRSRRASAVTAWIKNNKDYLESLLP